MTGRVLNQYEVQETLGAGGMGTVYRALDHTLKRTVALKFLAPGLSRTPTARAR
ncbi:MAG: serine/threonine protein kinase, partial [Bacteroidetes bacterium]